MCGVLISCSSPQKEKFAARDAYKLLRQLYQQKYPNSVEDEVNIELILDNKS